MTETEPDWDEDVPEEVPETDVGDDADVPEVGWEPTGGDTA